MDDPAGLSPVDADILANLFSERNVQVFMDLFLEIFPRGQVLHYKTLSRF